jgi:hypothetical protein
VEYEESNNLSARLNLDFVRKEVDKLVKGNVVQLLDYKPLIINPLTVAKRICIVTGTVTER